MPQLESLPAGNYKAACDVASVWIDWTLKYAAMPRLQGLPNELTWKYGEPSTDNSKVAEFERFRGITQLLIQSAELCGFDTSPISAVLAFYEGRAIIADLKRSDDLLFPELIAHHEGQTSELWAKATERVYYIREKAAVDFAVADHLEGDGSRATGIDTPDAKGYVSSPLDPSVYLPMQTILNEPHTPAGLVITNKLAAGILENYAANGVRWTRPLTKSGEPNPQRRNVHLGDWLAYIQRLKDPTKAADPPEPTPDEIQRSKAAIRAAKQVGK